MRQFSILFPLIILTGCAGSVQQLHELSPQANDFPSALASEYQSYADSESELGRSGGAEHFASKGLMALKGGAVEPDAVDAKLPEQTRTELTEARSHLSKLLTDDVKRVAPQQAARAQLLYDCWQNEMTRRINQEQAPCADEFRSTIQQLQEVADPLIYGKTISRTISFAPKTTKLDDDSLATIKEVAGTLSTLRNYRVQLDGYIGRKASQRKLSETRLSAVKKALVKAGINEHVIHIKKEGSAKAVILRNSGMAVDTKKVTIIIKINSQTKEHSA